MTASPSRLTLVLALAALCGCSAKTGTAETHTVQVLVEPSQAEVQPNKPVQFTAEVSGLADGSVSWTLLEANGGSVSAGGLYTAPSTEGTYHVRAVSRSDASAQGLATIKVSASATPVAISITTVDPAVYTCKAVTLTARVTGTDDPTVVWSVEGGAANGTITSGGVYTAPSTAGTYTVVAASRVFPAATARVGVVASDHIEKVEVSPSTVSVAPSDTAQFTARVTTSCGTVQALVRPPGEDAR